MALALQDSNLAWQRVKIALMNANPAAQRAFQGLKEWLAQQKGNPQLQFVPFVNTSIDDANGEDLGIDEACKVYGFYAKKTNTTEDAYIALFDDATNDATAGDQRTTLPLLAASEEAFSIHPQGLAMAAGIVAKSYTTAAGTTDTTAGSAADGFVLVGAA